MKKILQALDGASTKPVEGSGSMSKFLRVVKEAEAQVIDGPNGMKTTINPDGTKTVSDGSGTKTYNAQGQLVTTATPNLAGVQKTTDVKSGDVTTDYNQGPLSVSQTQTPGGYTKQSNTQYDLGMASVGQQKTGPNIAAGQLAGTTTNTVTDKTTGQAKQQIQGVGFGGASGPNVGKNYVGASDDDLVQHAANSTAGINPDDAATPVQARVAPTVSPTAPKTEKDVVDLNAKYNSKKPQAPAEDINRLRHLSGITEKDIEEAPVVKVVQPVKETKKGSGLIKHYFESVQTEAEQAFDQRRAKIKEQARRIAQRMREDAKVSAVDPAKKTITYTDDKTGISTTIPQAMAKPGEGGQVMVDKSQVNQTVGQDQQQPQPVKVGDMVKMLDTESTSAGVRMQRALQREKEKREFSQRYAEKNFPIGKKPEPIKEPVKDEGILSFMSKDKPVKKKPQALDPYAAKLLANRQQNKPPAPKLKVYQGPEEYRKEKDVAEGLPQTLRKVVPGYAKREIDKKMDAEKFGRTDVDRDANFQRYKKIQDKLKGQGAKDANADQVGAGKKIDTTKNSLRQRDLNKPVAEGNEDPAWINNLKLKK